MICEVLCRIVERFPNFLERVDVIAGTSSGALVALLLASGCHPKEIKRTMALTANTFFSNSKWRVMAGLSGIFRAKFGWRGRRDVLESLFGNLRMGELTHHVCIPVLQVIGHKSSRCAPKLFWNKRISTNNLDFTEMGLDANDAHVIVDDMKVVDVMEAASSMPLQFPTHLGHLDGALFANNPSLVTIALAAQCGVHFSDMTVLSLSTGTFAQTISAQSDADWGLVQWAPHLIDLIVHSMWGVTESACEMLLADRFYRWSEVIHDQGLDFASIVEIQKIEQVAAQSDLRGMFEWIQKRFQL
eukprot:c8539_g1_i2.p1 GENE.c8539_g1_i2~~c8539_g1_i2.p1  ORF type:complete len:301 (-),score=81.07 c8539_g1_i2:55-957(-)